MDAGSSRIRSASRTLSRGTARFPPQGPDQERTIRVDGNPHGLKANQVQRLERLCRRSVAPDQLVTQELAREMTELSREIRRLVGVLIDRRGDVAHVMVGDSHSIAMPDWGRMRAGRGRLRGLRCVHTSLGGEPLSRDDLTDLAKLRLDAIASLEVQEDGLPGDLHVAALRAQNDDGAGVQFLDPVPPSRLDLDFQVWIRELEEELSRTDAGRSIGDGERAILVVVTAGRSAEETAYSTEELLELARSAGVEVVEVVRQNRGRPDPKTVIGSGKLQDLLIRCFQSDVDLVIFDDDLNATQARNLAERLELRVIDRTQLILDIFAQHAKTRDGKLQVELAQLKYVLPRLAQRDTSLSRLGAGIGGRGPGETKLEVDRRRVRERVNRLERDLKKLGHQREHRRARRTRRELPVLSIVGYTNAGKSTLLRALTKKEVHVEDKMFATLDPASRRLRFPRDREVIITDTVGFIRDLPADLMTAFRSTLEEMREADVFLHVVDASHEDVDRRIRAVHTVLDEIGLRDGRPEILVFNKVDQLDPGEGARLAAQYGAVPVSALARTGLADLLERAETALFEARDGSRPPGFKELRLVEGSA
jgi:GTP-binding protein HflX